MIVTHNITMDLVRKDVTPKIDVVQDDKYSRDLEVTLLENGVPAEVPQDCKVMVLFEKSDGKGGAYDTMPDGTNAWKIKGNHVTVKLAPQVCTVPGKASVMFALFDGETQLNSFAVEVWVQKRPGMKAESRNYTVVRGFLPQPLRGEVGQIIRISETDDHGKVIAVDAVDGCFASGEETDHSKLLGRDATDQHPIQAITGLEEKLEALQNSSSDIHFGTDETEDGTVIVWVDTEDGKTVNLVATHAAAEVGQTIIVKSVNENGEPITWETADLPDSYSKSEIDAIMGAYINDIDALVGGDS